MKLLKNAAKPLRIFLGLLLAAFGGEMRSNYFKNSGHDSETYRDGLIRKLINKMQFKPLSKDNINDAIKLVHSIFVRDALLENNPAKAYLASLTPADYENFYKKHNLETLNYFIVTDDNSDKILGATGFYTRTNDLKDLIWLGWYCVEQSQRNKGIGKKILEWTMNKAKEKGFKRMKLYTSTDPNEDAAQKLYEKIGFKIIGEEIDPESPYKILFREKYFNSSKLKESTERV